MMRLFLQKLSYILRDVRGMVDVHAAARVIF